MMLRPPDELPLLNAVRIVPGPDSPFIGYLGSRHLDHWLGVYRGTDQAKCVAALKTLVADPSLSFEAAWLAAGPTGSVIWASWVPVDKPVPETEASGEGTVGYLSGTAKAVSRARAGGKGED